jgi:serine/threonine protein kinase
MECDITFEDSVWNRISNEGKDLTKKLVERDPELRISAKEALSHPWFTLEYTDAHSLAIAEFNINKYCNKGYFNVESIKPDFSMVRFIPLNTLRQNLVYAN